MTKLTGAAVTFRQWVERGEIMVNTECLDISDPDHIYNQIKAQGVDPEDFGITHPYSKMFANKTRGQLIEEIIELRKQIEATERHLAGA